MDETGQKYYPTVLQAIHLVILYIFIQTVVDFPLALIDYFKDTDYLYNPVKKVVLGVGSIVFILYYGFRKAKAPFLKVFPFKFFNPLILIPIATFLWGAHNLIEIVNMWVDKFMPAPAWFWEMFNRIFEGDFGWWGAFMKVAVIAPIIEESIFRGLILQGFRRNYNAFTAVFMSALLFALFHLNPWQLPATFVLGLLLGWLVIRTNSIFLSILGHSVNNAMVLLTMTYWRSISEYPIYLIDKKDFYYISALIVLISLIFIYFLSIPFWKRKKEKV